LKRLALRRFITPDRVWGTKLSNSNSKVSSKRYAVSSPGSAVFSQAFFEKACVFDQTFFEKVCDQAFFEKVCDSPVDQVIK
jgi:hypothetical protein